MRPEYSYILFLIQTQNKVLLKSIKGVLSFDNEIKSNLLQRCAVAGIMNTYYPDLLKSLQFLPVFTIRKNVDRSLIMISDNTSAEQS